MRRGPKVGFIRLFAQPLRRISWLVSAKRSIFAPQIKLQNKISHPCSDLINCMTAQTLPATATCNLLRWAADRQLAGEKARSTEQHLCVRLVFANGDGRIGSGLDGARFLIAAAAGIQLRLAAICSTAWWRWRAMGSGEFTTNRQTDSQMG